MSSRSYFNRDTSSEASTLLATITSFEFIVCLVVVKNCMGYTIGLSKKLQGRTEDNVSAYQSIDSVKSIVQQARQNIDEKFSVWFTEAVDIAASVNVNPLYF